MAGTATEGDTAGDCDCDCDSDFGPVNGVDPPVGWEPTNRWIDDPTPLTPDNKITRNGCHNRHRSMAGRRPTQLNTPDSVRS